MSWNLIRITEPQNKVVDLPDAKLHLRVDHDDEDVLIERIIDAATEQCQDYQNRAYITQEFKLTLPRFPFYGRHIRIPRPPLQSIAKVEYLDRDGGEQELSSDNYRVNTDTEPGMLVLEKDETWPDTLWAPDAVRVTFTAGYGDESTDVPPDYRSAVLLMVGHLYENREMVTVGSGPTFRLPMSLEWILSKRKFTMPNPIGAR